MFKNLFMLTSLKVFFTSQVCRSSTTMMRSVMQNKFGDAEEFYISENTPVPQPKADQILLRVYAASLNRADILMREGKYPGLKNVITLGLDASGVVESVGSNCTKWKAGDKVMALLNGGGYAEYAVVNQDHVMPMPDHLSFIESAAIPEVWLTAYQLLHFVGNMESNETVLIHGGGSGVGTAAIQLVKMAKSQSIVTAGTTRKIDFAKQLGAFAGFNYKEGEFAEKVKSATQGKGVNLILDCVAGSFWKQNIDCLATEGRWVVYGTLGGRNVDGPLLGQVIAKRASIIGTTLKARSNDYKARLVAAFSENAVPHFTEGNQNLHPVIDQVFPLESVAESHKYMESNKSNGKIVLVVKDHSHGEL